MKMQLLKYLEKPYNYQEGIACFKHYFPDHHLNLALADGYSMQAEDNMILLLKTVTHSAYVPMVEEEKFDFATPAIAKKIEPIILEQYSKLADDEAAKVIFDLKQEKARLYSQAATAHVELTRLKLSDKERYILALLIVENYERIDEIWTTFDYYETHGVLPNKYKYASEYEQGQEDRKRVLNLRTYISKLEREIPLAKTSSTKMKKNTKLNEFRFELNQLLNGN